MMDDFQKYKEFADQGATPNDISLAAKAEGGHFIERIKLVRQIFGLSLKEAKEVTIVADGLGTSLDDYQAKLIPGLKLAFYIEEQEDKGKLFAEILWNDTIVGVGLFDDFSFPVSGEWIPFNTLETASFWMRSILMVKLKWN